MEIINSSVRSLKIATYFISMIPSSHTLHDVLQAAEKPLSRICFGMQKALTIRSQCTLMFLMFSGDRERVHLE